ncbi:DUF2461 domain-containing protein [Jatrophihabitans sp. YIM 134969]
MARATTDLPFEGFPEEALDFFEGLEADNSKAYWTDHKDVYDRAVAAPMTALLAALAPEFGTAKFFRPYRDVRFSNDKTPYKTHAGAVVGGDGEAAYYVQMSAEGLVVAGGYWWCSTARARALRAALADDRTGPLAVRVTNTLQKKGFAVRGDELKRIPKPWDDTHPRASLLRRKALSASRHDEPAEWMHDPRLLDRVVDGWRAVRPLNSWLDTHVGPTA